MSETWINSVFAFFLELRHLTWNCSNEWSLLSWLIPFLKIRNHQAWFLWLTCWITTVTIMLCWCSKEIPWKWWAVEKLTRFDDISSLICCFHFCPTNLIFYINDLFRQLILIIKLIKSSSSFSQGEEIFNTFGKLGNAELLQMYGYTEDNNNFDTVTIIPSNKWQH